MIKGTREDPPAGGRQFSFWSSLVEEARSEPNVWFCRDYATPSSAHSGWHSARAKHVPKKEYDHWEHAVRTKEELVEAGLVDTFDHPAGSARLYYRYTP